MKRIAFVLIATAFAFNTQLAKTETLSPTIRYRSVVNVNDFGVNPDTGEDATLGVLRALEVCRLVKNSVLLFPKGTYPFHPDLARERYYAIANNWHKIKRVALPLCDFNGLTIDVQGSDFIIHGLILLVAVDGSKNIMLQNFSIDWERPSLSQGEVIESDATHFELRWHQFVTCNRLLIPWITC